MESRNSKQRKHFSSAEKVATIGNDSSALSSFTFSVRTYIFLGVFGVTPRRGRLFSLRRSGAVPTRPRTTNIPRKTVKPFGVRLSHEYINFKQSDLNLSRRYRRTVRMNGTLGSERQRNPTRNAGFNYKLQLDGRKIPSRFRLHDETK